MTERERALLQGKKINPLTANESALAYAVAHGGGSEPTYETVAEIQVGQMEGQEGQYSYEEGIETVPEISESETYYLNDESNPSTFFNHGSDTSMVGFNLKIDDSVPTRIDPSKPFVIVGFTDDVNDSLVVQSDTTDLSNTAVRILKKVEQGGGGALPENVKPTYEFGFTVTITAGQTEGEMVVTPDSGSTYAAISAALAETDNVYAVATLPDGEVLKAVFNDISQSFVSAAGLFYAGGTSYTAYRVRVQSDDSCDIAIVALADAH